MSSSPMVRCLGCMLIMAGALFELSSATGSGMIDIIEVTISSDNACGEVKAVVDTILGSSSINITNHTVQVDQETCTNSKRKRSTADRVYEVYMVDSDGVADDTKTQEVRNLLCAQCDVIKQTLKSVNEVLSSAFKSISCKDDTNGIYDDCVADAPNTTIIPMTTMMPPVPSDNATSPSTDIVIISSNASLSEPTDMPAPMNTTDIFIPMNTTEAFVSISTTESLIPTSTSSDTPVATSVSETSVSTSTSTPDVPTSSSRSTPVIESPTKTVAPPPSTSESDVPVQPSSSPSKPASSMSDAAGVTSTSSIRHDTTTLVTTTSSTPSEGTTDTSVADTIIIVVPATVLGAVLIVSILIICMMFMVFQFKRLRYEKNDKKRPANVWIDTRPSLGNQGGLVELKSENVRPMRPSRVSFMSKGNMVLQTLSHPLSVDELILSLQNLDKMVNEYMNVPSNLVSQNEIPVGAEEKNRYIDVLPNPNTRVPLFLKFGVAHSDYINANYIRGHRNQPKQYIATQGPLEHTVIDFWRMVWEQKVTVIIMATELIERNMEKCFQYWPDSGTGFGVTKVYGEIEVTIRKRNKGPSYTVTTFSIAHLERHVTRELTHYWFNGWPDHGVPNSATDLVDFLLETRTKREGFTMPGPTLVHCSAGIGRTGVFIATDIGMRQLEENMTVDVLKILATLRQDKGGMVQTKEQYIFIHKALKEYASRVGTVSNLPRFDSDEGQLNGGFYDEDEETVTTFA